MKTKLGILLTLTFLSSACGNIGPAGPDRVSEDSYRAVYGSSAADSENGDYTCASDPNVMPDYDWDFDGTGRYTVCPKKDSLYDILVHGETKQSNTICIFPAQVVDSSHVYVKPDLQTGLPLVSCVEITSAGATAQFPLVRYNAAFIVEEPDMQQMQACLLGGNYYSCPKYSFGKFR